MSIEELCARDLMSKNIVEIDRDLSLRVAVERMMDHGIHGLLVAPDGPNRGHCILTGKDCIEVLCTIGEDALDALCVEDAMTRPAVTIPADLCIADSIQLMRHAGVRTVPVVEAGQVVGVFTYTDVLRACVPRQSQSLED